MMISEFIERTGFEPTASEYAKIEKAYYDFNGNKDEFCKKLRSSRASWSRWKSSIRPRWKLARSRSTT